MDATLACVGVLQFDPMIDDGGLKQGVFGFDCVGVWFGESSVVGVLSGLRMFVGVELSFFRRIVFVSPLSLGGGGKDINDSWLPVNSEPVTGGKSFGFGGGGKLSKDKLELYSSGGGGGNWYEGEVMMVSSVVSGGGGSDVIESV